MYIENARAFIGPFMIVANIVAIYLCLRPKRRITFTLLVLLAYAVAVHGVLMILLRFVGAISVFMGSLVGILFLPVFVFLFRGQVFQKVFAFFIAFQLSGLLTAFTEMLVGVTVGYQNPRAQLVLLILSLLLLCVMMLLLRMFGRPLFARVFIDGEHANWALYSLGAVVSYVLIALLQWTAVGGALYAGLVLFILWNLTVLCVAIINTHKRAEKENQAQILLVQMDLLREQIDAEKKHRADMAILRHDIRHEAGVIAELYRAGKAHDAEAVYAEWQDSLSKAAPASPGTEPATALEGVSMDVG